MPWSRTTPMDQKTKFIADHLRGVYSISELCISYGISRKTAYKWIDRYLHEGPGGLEDRSRKLAKKRNRRRIGHPGRPTAPIAGPNDCWCADFKGQFKTMDGVYCFPLTVTDGHSRFLLACQARSSTKVEEAKPVFTRLFKEYGLPNRIRTDNGVPFATSTLARLSHLSAWWVRLGVLPELIEPGKPQQNGRHERMQRMHRTLPRRGPCRIGSRPWSTPITTRCVT